MSALADTQALLTVLLYVAAFTQGLLDGRSARRSGWLLRLFPAYWLGRWVGQFPRAGFRFQAGK